MDRNKNSIQSGYQLFNPIVCCLFIFIYIFVSRSFPLPSAFPSTDIERGKVFGLNTLRRRKIPTETACRPDLSTFKDYCTTFADEQRKGANDGIGMLIYYSIPHSNDSANWSIFFASSGSIEYTYIIFPYSHCRALVCCGIICSK